MLTPTFPIVPEPIDPQTALNNSATDSIDLVNSYIAACPENITEQQRRDDIKRNCEHLTTLIKQNILLPNNLTAARLAISSGEGWLQTRLD